MENVIFKMRLRPTFFELSEAMRSTFSLLPIGLSPVDGRFVLEVDEALLWLGGVFASTLSITFIPSIELNLEIDHLFVITFPEGFLLEQMSHLWIHWEQNWKP